MAQTLAAPTLKTPVVRQTRLLINNEWVNAADGGEFETYDPSTGAVIAKVAVLPKLLDAAKLVNASVGA